MPARGNQQNVTYVKKGNMHVSKCSRVLKMVLTGRETIETAKKVLVREEEPRVDGSCHTLQCSTKFSPILIGLN